MPESEIRIWSVEKEQPIGTIFIIHLSLHWQKPTIRLIY
jgi:hypothetical protein